jgi:hypothetical protein
MLTGQVELLDALQDARDTDDARAASMAHG